MRRVMVVAVGVAFAVGMGVAWGQTTQTEKKPTSNEVKVKLTNSEGKSAGMVIFKPVKQGVKMTVKLANIPPGDHGVHIHEHAVCDAPDFKAAGGHFNPSGKHHGFQNPEGHHNGDTPGNVSVGENHKGQASFVLTDVSMDPNLPNSIFANGGTSVVVHEHADDEKTDPSGNSGNRIACGVVKE